MYIHSCYPGLFGVPPEREHTVNYSSGKSITKAGPNTTLLANSP